MANFTINTSSSTAQTLSDIEFGFISQYGALVVASDDAVIGSVINHLTVLGTLSAQLSGHRAFDFDGISGKVYIGAQGYVSSGRSNAIEAEFTTRFVVHNAGTIQSEHDALELKTSDTGASINVVNSGVIQAGRNGVDLNSGAFSTDITNSGLIQANQIGIVTNYVSMIGGFQLVNSGEIIGEDYGYEGGFNSDQTIYNTGLISGIDDAAVYFGGGTNLYDGRGGEVIGIVQGGDGIDTLYGGAGFEEMYGGFDNDFMHGGGGDDILYGGADNDFMHGGGGIDLLYGDEGNDVMRGGDGNDEMYGGDGRDTMRGGVGADFLDGGDGAHDWLDYRWSTGAVTINLGTGQASGGDASGDGFVNFERIVGTSGDDRLTGDSGDNALRGDNGNDLLRGASGDDFITGGRGADTMLGSSGVDSLDYRSSSGGVTVNLTSQTASGGDAQGDIISGFENVYGSNADDVLTGSSAANLLFGGGGSDVFRFTSSLGGSNVDKITDFSSGTDTIELDDAIFSAIAQGPGTLLSGFFKANASGVATDSNDRIIYDTNGGQLYYDADGNSAGQALQFAQLTGAPALAFSDFDVV